MDLNSQPVEEDHSMDLNSPPFEEDHSMDLNSPPFEEDKDEFPELTLSLPSQPQPKRYKPNPFTFQFLQLEAPVPSFSSLLDGPFLEPSQSQPQPQPQSQPYTLPLQETYFSVPPNPTMSMLHQLDDMHEQEPLPPCDIPSQEQYLQDQETGLTRPVRSRRLPVRARKQGKTETITPPYKWATSTRATVHSLDHLLSQDIISIPGTVQCKRCEEKYEIQFDLKEKFDEVAGFIEKERDNMYDRAPESWNKPVLPTCNRCGKENSLEPVFTKKRTINWLFLLLGQLIGCCNLRHLKYFCKHTKNHRTGAKDRLIYLTYLGLCRQLKPDGHFDL